MPPTLNFMPIDDEVVSARRCPNCLAKSAARSVVTVPGRAVVIVTVACHSCGHQWTIEHESQSSLDQTLETPEPQPLP